ncbi:MAG: hypothetical protein Q9169_001891 [Polycauliona sp. 2 TL-2023]
MMLAFVVNPAFTFLLVCFCSVAGIVGAPTQDYQENPRHLQKRADSFAITGVPVIDGNIPQRLEIRELWKNVAQRNLYVLALNQYQQMNQTDVRSYFQLSSIHGRPFTEWDGVPLVQNMGYCSHTSNLFATWHRPYVLAFEQVLYGIVQEVATSITNDTTGDYKTAASTFRHPYWDWAAPSTDGSPVLPLSMSSSAFLTLDLPNGTLVVNNPLFQFTFAVSDLPAFPDPPFNIWQQTLRYPSAQNDAATSQNDLVSQQIEKAQSTYAQRIMNLLQAYPSLESLHNQIHGLMGNGGHMSFIDYAAFDPVFWLHHVQTDRLLAIWQALYPDSYVEASVEPFGSAVVARGAQTDVDTELMPFHSDTNGSFWTSAGVANVEQLGYSYPEIQGKSQGEIKAALNALYADSSGVTLTRRDEVGTVNSSLAVKVAAGVSSDAPVEPIPEPPTTGNYTEWLANIRVAKDALEQAFFIHIFLGDFDPNPQLWTVEPNLVGAHAIITPYVMKRDPLNSVIVTGQIPLTRSLRVDEQDGLLNLTDETATKEYLTRNLHWRVTTMGDKEVPRDQVPDLKIAVISANVQAAEADDQFPVWGEMKVQSDITNGRPAGLAIEDDS